MNRASLEGDTASPKTTPGLGLLTQPHQFMNNAYR